jgi:hypothetical protein
LDSKLSMKITVSRMNTRMHEIRAEVDIMTCIVAVKLSSRRTQTMTVNHTGRVQCMEQINKEKILNLKIWKQGSTWQTSSTCEDRTGR